MRVVETRSGKLLDDRIEGGYGSYATAAWSSDNRGFFYARFSLDPAKSELEQVRRFHRLYYHRLGDPQARDRLVAESPDEPTRRYFPAITDDGSTLVVTTALGSESSTRTWIGSANAATKLTEPFASREASLTFVGGSKNALYFLGALDAREALYLVDPASGHAQPVVEPGDDTLLYANLVAGRLIVFRNRSALPVVTIHALDGSQERELSLPPLATVWGPGSGGLGFVGRAGDRFAYFLTNGLADPGTLHRLDPVSGERSVWREPDERIDPSRFTAQQVFFRSYDGTRVPMLIAWRKDLDRSKPQPVWMYAYGALGWPAFPFYQPHIVSWMERGGIYALPGIRGGGEYGEAWHKAGIRENRANAIDDYLAAAEWLADHAVTTRGMLVANGGSISGAAASEAIVTRPDLFAAAVIDIPVTDLLRYNRFTGAGMWVPEFGDAKNPAELPFLLRHSPYQMIRAGRCYPPTLVSAGQVDQTAVPSHAYKFVAALQHAQTCANAILLNAVEETGHTFGSTPAQTAETDARRVIFAETAIRSAARGAPSSGGDDEPSTP
jgi:prolyl oligopeptidase